jgi:hypothetical protein
MGGPPEIVADETTGLFKVAAAIGTSKESDADDVADGSRAV